MSLFIGPSAYVLYRGNLCPSSIPENLFSECMLLTSEELEFSFNDMVYIQTDSVAMGSYLCPILTNIFVGYYEPLLLDKFHKPYLYIRYVDDTISIFDSSSDLLISSLNLIVSILPSSLLWGLRMMGHNAFWMFMLTLRMGYSIPAFSVNYVHRLIHVGVLLSLRLGKLF